MGLAYTLLLYFLTPLVLLRLLYRSIKAPAYRRRWGERFGFFPAPEGPCLWLHAVSVGETLAAVPLIKRLMAEYPGHRLVVTTTTPTGSERVRAAFGDRVFHVYAPYDLPGSVARFMRRVQPELVVIMETELWPNLFRQLKRRRIPLIVANARLSPNSFKGYKKLAGLTRHTLSCVSVVAAQSRDDGERFRALGLPAEHLQITGNLKYDLSLADDLVAQGQALRAQLGEERPVWIAASTHRGEDELMLEAHRHVLDERPDALLILVPRHPERFDDVAHLVSDSSLSLVRRSEGTAVSAQTQVYVGDSMGEMMLLYAACDLAYVGGSLVATGGHNLLEPAALAKPVLCGPHTFNFKEIRRQLEQAGGMFAVNDSSELARGLLALWQEPARAKTMGEAGAALVEANRGALERLLALIQQQHKTH